MGKSVSPLIIQWIRLSHAAICTHILSLLQLATFMSFTYKISTFFWSKTTMKRKASLRELRTTESPPNTASIATTQKNASSIEVADVAASSSLEDFSCSLCRETIKEAFMTSCGHSFCHACISTHCDQTGHCPSCNFVLSQNNLFPNFMREFLKLIRFPKSQQVDWKDFLTHCQQMQFFKAWTCCVGQEWLFQAQRKYSSFAKLYQ